MCVRTHHDASALPSADRLGQPRQPRPRRNPPRLPGGRTPLCPEPTAPTQVMIEPDHDIRNPAGQRSNESLPRSWLIWCAYWCSRRVNSNGMVFRLPLTASATGDQFRRIFRSAHIQAGPFTNLEAGPRRSKPSICPGWHTTGWATGQVSRAVHDNMITKPGAPVTFTYSTVASFRRRYLSAGPNPRVSGCPRGSAVKHRHELCEAGQPDVRSWGSLIGDAVSGLPNAWTVLEVTCRYRISRGVKSQQCRRSTSCESFPTI